MFRRKGKGMTTTKNELLFLITCRVDHIGCTDWMHKMNLSSSFFSSFFFSSLKLLSF